jgi:hypothetical protein
VCVCVFFLFFSFFKKLKKQKAATECNKTEYYGTEHSHTIPILHDCLKIVFQSAFEPEPSPRSDFYVHFTTVENVVVNFEESSYSHASARYLLKEENDPDSFDFNIRHEISALFKWFLFTGLNWKNLFRK